MKTALHVLMCIYDISTSPIFSVILLIDFFPHFIIQLVFPLKHNFFIFSNKFMTALCHG